MTTVGSDASARPAMKRPPPHPAVTAVTRSVMYGFEIRCEKKELRWSDFTSSNAGEGSAHRPRTRQGFMQPKISNLHFYIFRFGNSHCLVSNILPGTVGMIRETRNDVQNSSRSLNDECSEYGTGTRVTLGSRYFTLIEYLVNEPVDPFPKVQPVGLIPRMCLKRGNFDKCSSRVSISTNYRLV